MAHTNRRLLQGSPCRRRCSSISRERRAPDSFLDAYNFAKRLKTLRGLTPYETICKAWADQPRRFTYDPTHLTSGLRSESRITQGMEPCRVHRRGE
ncbi:hypothetical protein BQ8482_60100 [Mesorhizobium delmotii]|uniref:Uncharacterized protein n=1 Tax=Mesorhizobium delmotii TaxID=1631247 RepID=A0A2P9AVA1_9HYPH|nr:hypothetical protein BQ8482_60100 [Mesorhizobium delmotii]